MNLEFFIRLREMVSGGLAKMADTARKTSNSIRGANDTLGQSYDEIRRKISELESSINKSTSVKHIREARRELDQLNKMASSHKAAPAAAGGGGGLLGMAARFIGPVAIGAAVSGIMGAGIKQEQDVSGLKTFLGQQGAEQVYANVQKDSMTKALGYDMDSLLMVNKSLISAGLSADKAREDTLNLANAVAAVGGGNDVLSRMAANMQQIKTVGKASSMDIKQFAMAGINIYKLLSDATGKSVAQVQEMDVSYDLLSASLAKAAGEGGLYAGALEAQGNTIAGKIALLRKTFSGGVSDIGVAMQPVIRKLVDFALTIANIVVPAMVGFVGWIKENWTWLSAVVGVLGAAITAYYAVILATKAWAAIQMILNAVMTANPIGLVIAGIAALVAGIVWAWNKFEGFRMVVLGMWEVFKQVFTNIGNFFKKIFEPIAEAIAAFKEGRYGDAAVAVAKMAGNLSPVGFAANALVFAKEGGFSAGVRNAALKGMAAGRNASSASSSEAPESTTLGGAVAPSGAGAGADEAVKGITNGGPRVININITKMVEKLEVHSTTLSEGLSEIESKIEETFLRVLNSGAAVQ